MRKGKDQRNRTTGPRGLASVLGEAMDATTRARGFTQAAVLTQWPAIVGEGWARECAPQKLVFARGQRAEGTLHIRAPGGVAIELQHLEPVLVERINRYFGFRAVARLALSQAPLAEDEPSAAAPRPVALTDDARLRETVSAIINPELRGALLDLGRGVARDRAARQARHARRG